MNGSVKGVLFGDLVDEIVVPALEEKSKTLSYVIISLQNQGIERRGPRESAVAPFHVVDVECTQILLGEGDLVPGKVEEVFHSFQSARTCLYLAVIVGRLQQETGSTPYPAKLLQWEEQIYKIGRAHV